MAIAVSRCKSIERRAGRRTEEANEYWSRLYIFSKPLFESAIFLPHKRSPLPCLQVSLTHRRHRPCRRTRRRPAQGWRTTLWFWAMRCDSVAVHTLGYVPTQNLQLAISAWAPTSMLTSSFSIRTPSCMDACMGTQSLGHHKGNQTGNYLAQPSWIDVGQARAEHAELCASSLRTLLRMRIGRGSRPSPPPAWSCRRCCSALRDPFTRPCMYMLPASQTLDWQFTGYGQAYN